MKRTLPKRSLEETPTKDPLLNTTGTEEEEGEEERHGSRGRMGETNLQNSDGDSDGSAEAGENSSKLQENSENCRRLRC